MPKLEVFLLCQAASCRVTRQDGEGGIEGPDTAVPNTEEPGSSRRMWQPPHRFVGPWGGVASIRHLWRTYTEM